MATNDKNKDSEGSAAYLSGNSNGAANSGPTNPTDSNNAANLVSPNPQTPTPSNLQPIMPMAQQSFFQENKWSIIVIIVSLLVLGTVGYFIFRKPSQTGPQQPNVQVSIDAPIQAPSGSEVVYKVKVANNDSAGITNISMDTIFPQGFNFEDATPKPTKLDGTQFALPTIEPGQDTTIMIKGTIQGNVGETKTISAIMHYNFSNITSQFIAQAQAQTQIQAANISLQFDGQSSVSNNQDLTYVLSYANATDQPVNNFKITISLPKNFKLKSENPNPNYQQIFQLGTLDPNETGKITFIGDFENAQVTTQQVFNATAEGSSGTGSNFVLATAQLPVTLGSQALEADITYQGESLDVNPGDHLSYDVKYQNNSTNVVHGASITVTLTGPYNLDNIQLNSGVINGNVITWDASQIPSLASVPVSASGDIRFSVEVNNPATRGAQKNLTLVAQPAMQSSEYQQPFIGTNVTLKVSSQPQISPQVSYLNGAQPPTVGQKTTYVVEIDLRNTTNDINNTRLTLSLPNASNFDVTTVNSDESANVNYDKSTKQLSWNVSTLTANAGSFSPLRKLIFQVSIVPQSSQRSHTVDLVTNIKLTGTDSFTQESLNLTSPDLSTQNVPGGNTVQ